MGAGASAAPTLPKNMTEGDLLCMLQEEEDCVLFKYLEPEEASECEAIFSSFSSSPQLYTKVSLSEQELADVPPGVTSLASVIALNLSSNAFTLSSLVPLLMASNCLMQLNLSSNPELFLSSLPSPFSLGCASTLLHLDVSVIEISEGLYPTFSTFLEQLKALLQLDAESCSLSKLPALPIELTILNLKDNELESLPQSSAFPPTLTSLDFRENPCVDTTPHYKKTILDSVPTLTTLDGFSTAVVSADSNPVDLKEAVENGLKLKDDTGHLIAENEFNAAMTNKVDNTVVG